MNKNLVCLCAEMMASVRADEKSSEKTTTESHTSSPHNDPHALLQETDNDVYLFVILEICHLKGSSGVGHLNGD